MQPDAAAPSSLPVPAFSAAWLATCQLMLVALLWGTTNPCLNRASQSAPTQNQQQQPPATSATASSTSSPGIVALLLNWRFVLPFVLNQLGSLLYLHCLGQLSLSFAVPTVNSLTMVITAVTAHAMGERTHSNKRVWAGMAFMLAGICMCILSQQQQQQQQQQSEVQQESIGK